MDKINAKVDILNAERAIEHWMRKNGCVYTRRAIKAKWQKQDIFGGDCVGKDAAGRLWVVQATTGDEKRVWLRKKTLEKIPWALTDFVAVAQLRPQLDPVHRRKTQYFFRIIEYRVNYRETAKTQMETGDIVREWVVWTDPIEVPPDWCRAYKPKKNRPLKGIREKGLQLAMNETDQRHRPKGDESKARHARKRSQG